MRGRPAVWLALSIAPALIYSDRSSSQQSTPAESAWTQWGGPTRDFHSSSTRLADSWPATGPPVLWSRPLGTGHSAIVVDAGRLFTMYRSGNGRTKQGPWKDEEVVAALDARTGATLWEHPYPSRREDFSFGAGPHATPLVVGDRVFTIGTNQQLFAFDKRTGQVLWSHDFIKEFKSPELLIRPQVKVGYGCSAIAFRDTIICSVGGPGQSVMAFRQSNGEVVWKSGDFLTASAAPILIQVNGRPQVVFLGGGTITGLDPATGAILWSHPHDPGNDLNCGTPIFGPDNVLFVSSGYQAGSRAIRLTPNGSVIDTEELWFTSRVRYMFLSAVRIGDFVYGTSGDFGPAFLTALDIKTGQAAWQVRGFARASLLYADGKVIVMNEDGDLALARLSPSGAEILARAKVFDTTSWTAPTLVGTTLYARDREKIVALDLSGPSRAYVIGDPPPRRADAGAAPLPPPLEMHPPALLAGTWTLDSGASTQADGVTFHGLAAAGPPPWIFVTQPENGTLLLESPINAGHARFYRPGRSTTTDIAGGTITMTAAWEGNRLVAEGRTAATGGAVGVVKETLSRDGAALVIEITEGEKSSRFRYTHLADVGPCESWPTPCKR